MREHGMKNSNQSLYGHQAITVHSSPYGMGMKCALSRVSAEACLTLRSGCEKSLLTAYTDAGGLRLK